MRRNFSFIIQLILSLFLTYLAFDYREALLANQRGVLIWSIPIGFVVLLVTVVLLLRSKQKVGVVHRIPLVFCLLGLLVFAVNETRFQLEKELVFSASQERLETLGRHIVVGYRDADEIKRLVNKRALAGVFITRRNIEKQSIISLRNQISSWQAIRKRQGLPPLWIATDQEGGIISRMSPPLTKLPPLAEVVKQAGSLAERKRKAREYGEIHGKELSELGINLNFAPVVDINKGMQDPLDFHSVIYRRAISHDAAVVAEVARDYCQGLFSYGVYCTFKHFPGLGRVTADTHDHSVALDISVEMLEQDDWVPFRKNMGLPGSMVMLGHPILTALDEQHPVSFSKKVVSGLLREKWAYDGLLITDDFSMDAVMDSKDGVRQAAVKALEAGVDLILIAYDTDLYYPIMNALLGSEQLNAGEAAIADQGYPPMVAGPGRVDIATF